MEGLTPAPAAFRELLRQKLANAANRIQWTYSIFWSFSPEQQLLVWREGYLNGTDSTELSLRRSRQLQELFVAMNANRGAPSQSSEASAGVSVVLQDLTPSEWFYMYSMACSYATGVGLPGRVFAEKKHVWHCITGEGDTRVCVRDRLAQRSQIQTMVCIPALDGVVEFGSTILVEEDTYVLQQMQSVFLEQPEVHPTRTGIKRVKTRSPLPPRQAREMPSSSYTISSAFTTWKRVVPAPHRLEFLQSHRQRMLKAAVLTIPRLYAVKEVHVEEFATRAGEQSSDLREGHRFGSSSRAAHVIAERRRREKLTGGFSTLRSLVPSARKRDKVSLLGDAIEYVRGLQRRLEELECSKKKLEEASVKQHVEVTIEKSISVSKISCAWKDGLLVDILLRMINLQLEVVDATAKVSNGVLKATLKAKATSSDINIAERIAEIQAAVLSTIEEKLSDKATTTQQ